MNDVTVAIVGGCIGVLQAIIIFILDGLKKDITELKENDIKDLWKRVYGHYHEIECKNQDCTPIRTGNVIVPHERS